jgi:hypothetical protein
LNNESTTFVSLKSHQLTSNSSRFAHKFELERHHNALVNVSGNFHHFADIFFNLLEDENIDDNMFEPYVDHLKFHQSSTNHVKLSHE